MVLCPSKALCLSIALCPLYSLCFSSPVLFSLCSLRFSFQPSVFSNAHTPLYGPLLTLWPSVPSMALYPLYDPLFPQQPSVPSLTLCTLYGPLSSLRPSVLSMALCLLNSHLFCSKALCPRYGPLFLSYNTLYVTCPCALSAVGSSEFLS